MLKHYLFQKKFEGTRVTIENFLAWKAKFDAAMAEVDKKKSQTDPFSKKLSGWFIYMTCIIKKVVKPSDT